MAGPVNMRILVAVDGSVYGLRAVEHVLRLTAAHCAVDVHLLNVQMQIDSGHVRQFIAPGEVEAYYRDEGTAALQAASAALESAGLTCTTHIVVGHIAETIARYASEFEFDLIVIGTHGRTGLRHVVMGSVATEVVRRATVPVTIVRNT